MQERQMGYLEPKRRMQLLRSKKHMDFQRMVLLKLIHKKLLMQQQVIKAREFFQRDKLEITSNHCRMI